MAMRPAELGTVRLMNLIADCSTTHGISGSGVSTAPRTDTPWADERELGEDERHRHPPEVRLPQLVGDRAQADLGELRDEHVDGDDHERRDQQVAWADAAQRRDLRLLRAGRLGTSDSKVLERHLVCPSEVADVRSESRRLQVWHRSRHGVDAGAADGGAQRAVRTDEHRAGDEQLCHVDVQRGSRSAEGGGREADQDGRIVDDHHVAQVQPPVRDVGRVESCHLLPHVSQGLVADVLGNRVLERIDVSLPGDDQCVAVRAQGSRDHLGHPDSGLGGHEDRQCLVLDLLQSADRHAPRRVPVGQQAPTTRQPLSVLGVSTQHARVQRPVPVVSDVLRRADPLAARHAHVVDLDAERGEREAHVLGPRHAGGGPERQPHQCGSTETERQAREDIGRQSRVEYDGTQRREADEPGGEHADRSHELRAGDCEHRGDAGDA